MKKYPSGDNAKKVSREPSKELANGGSMEDLKEEIEDKGHKSNTLVAESRVPVQSSPPNSIFTQVVQYFGHS